MYYYINIHHCKNCKSHSMVVRIDLNARRLEIQLDQPTLAVDSWVSILGYLYWIKCVSTRQFCHTYDCSLLGCEVISIFETKT